MLLLVAAGCGEETDGPGKGPVVNPPEKITPPEFSVDSAYFFIEKQLAFGPRVPNTAAHQQCGDWLAKKFQSYTEHVHVQQMSIQAHDGKTLRGRNIIASFNPENQTRIMVSAHWDSRPWADADPDSSKHNEPVIAANDGASGVAVLLEIARQLKAKAPNIGVDICLWDLEDYGVEDTKDSYAYGAQHWSKYPHKQGYKAKWGINLDMVGAQGAQFAREGISDQFASSVVDRVWGVAAQLGYQNYFVNVPSPGVTDDHYYINVIAKIKYIDVIDRNPNTQKFFPHWHTTTDDISNIDKKTLNAVGKTTLAVIYAEK